MTNRSNTTHISESYGQRVLRLAFSGWGARLGLAWVLLLIFMAVFAPYLANSMPLLASEHGVLTMPVLRYTTAEDVLMLSAFISALLLWKLKLNFIKKLWIFTLVVISFTLIAQMLLTPPKLIIYDSFRAKANNAEYDWAVLPPIPYSPSDFLRDYGDTSLEAPFAADKADKRVHIMGTDDNGADVASRMIHASRIALGIGFVATGIAMVIGIFIGGQMGYFSGRVDMFGMRLMEIFEAIPVLFLLLTIIAFFGRSIYLMMIIIGITGWSGYARYVRAEFLKLRKQDYVQAAIASGLPLQSILFRHILPNGIAPLLVAISFGVASAILTEATLSFLGLGPVDVPSWGQMLNQAVKSSTFNWWMAAFPGGAIFLTVFAYNLIGEALRDAIDPQLAGRLGVN
ncbi:MAG: ABC transporter permease [Aquificaceae bacterium]|nr:MAG: ABC transporter permease [Aquificaceae bacterium]